MRDGKINTRSYKILIDIIIPEDQRLGTILDIHNISLKSSQKEPSQEYTYHSNTG